MTLIFWCLLLVGFTWTGVFVWYYLEKPGNKRLLYKAAATAGPALLALAGALWRGRPTDWLLFVAAVLFVAADVALEVHMLSGVLLFLAGHLGVCIILRGQGASLRVAGTAALLGLAAVLWVHRSRFKKMGRLTPVLLVYVTVLFAMLGAAVSCLWQPDAGAATAVTAVGAGCFVVSDMLLGDAMLCGYRTRSRHWWIMGLYETAVLLLALAPYLNNA